MLAQINQKNGEISITEALIKEVKVLFVELSVKGGLWCYKDGYCVAGLILDADPIFSQWLYKKEIKVDLYKALEVYRFYTAAASNILVGVNEVSSKLDNFVETTVIDSIEFIPN